jgi:hypothetical protein
MNIGSSDANAVNSAAGAGDMSVGGGDKSAKLLVIVIGVAVLVFGLLGVLWLKGRR